MEEERAAKLTISDLIRHGQPFTAASSLVPSCPISASKQPHKKSRHSHKPCAPTPLNPNPETLKSLNFRRPLIGTIILPVFSSNKFAINCSCFQFSDDTATVCCYVLDFDPKMIGEKIQILCWNFIPTKCVKHVFLEITRWGFLQANSRNLCSLSPFCSFCWTSSACDMKYDSKAKFLVFGVIESVSPVSTVPCSTSRESDAVKISGFLVNVLVCECKFCSLVSELKNLNGENVEDHCFTKTAIVYFCGLTSSWHPVISRLIGEVVVLSMLKKKLVFVGKEESQLMYVAMDNMSLHILKLVKKQSAICNGQMRGKGYCGSYTGVITGVYMQGMVVELDQDVILLLTDQYLTVPHCMRIGAIVTLKNVHLVNPKFSWVKMLILGACCRTSVFVESFSPLKSGCYLRSYSFSPLQNFIDSLSFSARLWVLLVISCFRKKFAGILSEQEILGSKHKEGLVQKYASSQLPVSAFRKRHGVLLEFCNHDSYYDVEEPCYGHLRLVLPIANLINYCEVSWKKILGDWENCTDFVGCINQKKSLLCDGRFYEHPIRRVLRAQEIGFVVLGTLKFSFSSGRLQLVDATGGVDIVLGLPPTWDFDKIFESKDFIIVIEGIPRKPVDLNSRMDQPLSCRSIFSNAPLLVKQIKTSLYLYHDPSDKDARSDSLFFDWKRNSKELGSGKYHLLMLTHKFPVRKKGYQANRSNMFAQAIVLPWDLLVAAKQKVSDFCENLTNHKRCKIDQVSIEASDCGSIDAGNESGHFSGSSNSISNSFKEKNSASNDLPEIPCLIANKRLQSHLRSILHCTSDYVNIISGCKPPRSKVLLEFGPNSLCMYEVLKVGCCYLFEHKEEDKLCSKKGNYKIMGAKLFINSDTHLWSLNISSIEGLQSSDASRSLHASTKNLIPKGFEVSSSTKIGVGSEVYSDIDVYVDADAKNSILNVVKILENGTFEPTNSFKESSGSWCVDYPSLPVGNLITLHGLVVGLHDCDGPGQLRLIPREGCLPMFLQGNGCVCIHLLVENCTVTIFSDLSKQAHPIGLGRDVYATFHRVLVLSGLHKYMMLPVSFITINNIGLVKYKPDAELSNSESVAFPDTVPTELISDVLQSALLKPKEFRCRVVSVYLLVVEKTEKAKVAQSSVQGRLSVGTPLAGFIIDDGSSSCCCWSESERAATLLGLYTEKYYLPLNRILEQHGRVVVRNYGSIVDSLCQDLSFSLGSGKSISSSDEDLITSLVINPSFSTSSWIVTGSNMDQEACRRLEDWLTELGIVLPPLPNVWATSVGHTDMLAEARNIFQEL